MSYPLNRFDDAAPDVPTEDVLAEIARYEDDRLRSVIDKIQRGLYTGADVLTLTRLVNEALIILNDPPRVEAQKRAHTPTNLNEALNLLCNTWNAVARFIPEGAQDEANSFAAAFVALDKAAHAVARE